MPIETHPADQVPKIDLEAKVPPRMKRSYSEKVLAVFKDPGSALRVTVMAVLANTLLYVCLHTWLRVPPPEIRDAIHISDDGRFKCDYRDDILDRFFARNKVNEWKQRMDEKSIMLSGEALIRRKDAIISVQRFVSETLSGQGPLGVLGIAREKSTDTDYLILSLIDAERWLERQRDQLHPSRIRWLEECQRSMLGLIQEESAVRRRLMAEVDALQSSISFQWFYITEWYWVIEVLFWSIYGVLANTLITLIQVSREDRYDSREFVLALCKMVMAPVLAIVVIAWWASGNSEAKISFANLPYFLVLCFSLGFVTEGIYAKIRELATLLVGQSVTASLAKMEASAQREKYSFVTPRVVPESLPAAKSMTELKQQLTNTIKSSMERGVVAQLSGKSDSPS